MASQLELTQKPFIELQIEALVQENRVKPNKVNKFIDQLEARIIDIKEMNYEKLLNKQFRLPILGRPNSMNDDYPKNFSFVPPEKVEVIGGFQTSTVMKKTNFIDLAISMPPGSIDKKDIKNQKYHLKRALYLAQLAHLLNGSTGVGLIEKLEYCYHQGDFLKPVLLIIPKDTKLRKRANFQLFLHPPSDCPLKLSLLKPDHGNIAPNWFYKDHNFDISDQKLEEFIEQDSEAAPSPFYNSSLLFDIEMISNSDILLEQIGTQSSITEALMLTKIWLYQRELHSQFSFIITMFIAYLQTRQLVHQNMSSFQIFKIIIKSIATSNWDEEGLSYFDDFKDKISTFKTTFPVIFLSPSGNLNLCFNITLDLYQRLKHEAHLSQAILDSKPSNLFDLLFLRKLSFVNKFDVIVHLPHCFKKLPINLDYLKKRMDCGIFTPRTYSDKILHLLQKSLTDRTCLIQQSPSHYMLEKRWNIKSIPYDPSVENNTFSLGLLLEPEKSLRIIDVGPKADTPEAEEFRQFWEPKSELRLQNGIISETVVWHVDSFSQRRAIIRYILNHALKRADISNIVTHYTMLERFISLNNIFFKWRDENNDQVPTNGVAQKRKRDETKHSIGVGEEIFQRVLHSYNELNKIVRGIENMKHIITGIHPTSHHLRGSSVFPPLPVSLQLRNKSLKRRQGVSLFPEEFSQAGKILHIEPVEILLTLDSSGKWPNELEALEAAKLEYLIELGEALKEREYSVKFSENYLDVLHGQFVFRLRVKCQKELNMIGPACGKLELQKRRLELEIMPRVHAALDQLYREKLAFGLTCRLVKRWTSCHLMTDNISDIALDLMVAHLFLHPQPYTEPASSSCGFKRFLMLVAQHDWETMPLVINFDNQLKIDEMNRIKELMLEDRSKFPPIVLCTPYDKDISPWTRIEPTQAKFDLISRVCTKALLYLNKEILGNLDVTSECKALFLPNFKIFNLLIKLHPHIVQNFFMSINGPKSFRLEGKEPNTKHASAFSVMPIVGLNIIEQYVRLLQSKYGNLATFFYDKYGQRLIGVVLKPESEKLLDGDLNKLIKGIKALGSKLVESITIVKKGN